MTKKKVFITLAAAVQLFQQDAVVLTASSHHQHTGQEAVKLRIHMLVMVQFLSFPEKNILQQIY